MQPSIFYKLFGGSFCEKPLVLGKTDYLVTSNVRFGTVSINPVTYNESMLLSFLQNNQFSAVNIIFTAVISHTVHGLNDWHHYVAP